jgi:hypothetical protein
MESKAARTERAACNTAVYVFSAARTLACDSGFRLCCPRDSGPLLSFTANIVM